MVELPREHGTGERPLVKSQQDLAAGLFLVAIAAAGFYGAIDLSLGRLAEVGPGMVPKVVSALVLAFGLVLVAGAFLAPGNVLGRWPLRGAFFVLGAAVVFAWTIRPLGLVVAGPAAVLFASCADRGTRAVEIIPFALALTGFCIVLFSYVLRLPVPVWPSALPSFLDRLF